MNDDLEGFVRLIVESFRGAPFPSVEVAVEEIMRTFENELARRDARIEQLERKYVEACARSVGTGSGAEVAG